MIVREILPHAVKAPKRASTPVQTEVGVKKTVPSPAAKGVEAPVAVPERITIDSTERSVRPYDTRGRSTESAEPTAVRVIKPREKPLPTPEEAIVQIARARAIREAAVARTAAIERGEMSRMYAAEHSLPLQRCAKILRWADSLSDAESAGAMSAIDTVIGKLVRSGANGSPKLITELQARKLAIQDAQSARARVALEHERELARQVTRRQIEAARTKHLQEMHAQTMRTRRSSLERKAAAEKAASRKDEAKQRAHEHVLEAHQTRKAVDVTVRENRTAQQRFREKRPYASVAQQHPQAAPAA